MSSTEEGLDSEGKCSISEAELAQEGRYTIEAANKVGRITADVSVTGGTIIIEINL